MAALLGIVANAMFLDAYGSAWLPVTYIAIGVAGIAVSGAVARTAQRFELLGIALVVLGAAAAALGVSWVVARAGAAWVSVPLLVLFPILIQLGFVFIGGQAGRLLDIAGIKASFPRIMAGFPAGAVIGGLLGAQLVTWFGRTEDLLLATALAQAAFAALVWVTGRRYAWQLGSPGARPAPDGGADTNDRTTRPSIRKSFGSRFVALILVYQVLSALGSQLADFLVYDRAIAQYPDPADLARFLAGYTAVMNAVSIAFLFALAGPLLRRFGLKLGIAANPLVLTVFAVAMIAAHAVSGGTSFALLATVSAARIADIALTDGTTRTSINATYQVLPERDRLSGRPPSKGSGCRSRSGSRACSSSSSAPSRSPLSRPSGSRRSCARSGRGRGSSSTAPMDQRSSTRCNIVHSSSRSRTSTRRPRTRPSRGGCFRARTRARCGSASICSPRCRRRPCRPS